MNFANQVVPIFTKLGCNAGGCHGKASGQNGFRLSLLGFEPALDYETLVKEGRGRRLFPAAPDASLLLAKATAKVPHGGGKRLDPESHEYRLIRRWIASGCPSAKPADPNVERIAIYPGERVLAAGQRPAGCGHRDLHRWHDRRRDPVGAVPVERDRGRRGGAGGACRDSAAFGSGRHHGPVPGAGRGVSGHVPLKAAAAPNADFPVHNTIDAAALKQWKALGLAPSALCSDAEFIRRASLDITGTLPAARGGKGVRRRALIPASEPSWSIELLDRPEYAAFFAIKWADILRNKREGRAEVQSATFNFHDWIRESLAKNVPYDQFVRGILAASGSSETAPPVQWYRKLRETSAFVDDTAQVFLGMRLQCAECHHHPFEKWSQHDYYSFAAFFARVGRKPDMKAQRSGRDAEVIYTAAVGNRVSPQDRRARWRPRGWAQVWWRSPPAKTRGRSWSTGWPMPRTRSSRGHS